MLMQKEKVMQFNSQSLVVDKVDHSYSFLTEPYLYVEKSTGKIFIIQSVVGGDLGIALFVCKNWQKEHENCGFDTKESASLDLPFVVYSISVTQTLKPFIDNSQGEKNYYFVLAYMFNEDGEPNRFAAMLPLI